MAHLVTVGLSLLAGAALGAAAMQTLHAQATPPAFSIAEIAIKDQDGYAKEFLPAMLKAIDAEGGKYIVRGGKTVSHRGAAPAARVVVVQYDSLQKADAWWNSPATQEALKLGSKYADIREFAVELAPR